MSLDSGAVRLLDYEPGNTSIGLVQRGHNRGSGGTVADRDKSRVSTLGRGVAGTVLILAVLGLTVWAYGPQSGFHPCVSSPERDAITSLLVQEGFTVECRKEPGSPGYVFPQKYLALFVKWAEAANIHIINEQPGYFWFWRVDPVTPGLVSFDYAN